METISLMSTGTVSHGTHRPQDLIPTFVEFIATYIEGDGKVPEWDNITKQYQKLGNIMLDQEHTGNSPFTWEWKEDNDPEWDSEDTSILLDYLFETMDSIAPEGFYFGANEGDGSDYGFWAQCIKDAGGSCADCPHLNTDYCPELECDL